MVWRCAWEKCVEKIIPEIGGGQWRTMGLSLGTPFLFLYLLWPTLLFGTIFLPITLDIIDGPKTYIIYFYWCTGLLKAIRKIKIPLKFTDLQDGVDKHVVEQWPVLDPHSIFAFLTEHAGLTIPIASLKEYWEFNSRHGEPWAQGVPTDTMPLGLYRDGARVHTKFGSTNLIGIYFNLPLWKPQSVRASRFLVTVIPEERVWSHHTMNAILRRATWSINSLIDGQQPSQGPHGEQLPPDLNALANQPFLFKCRLTEIRGDWQWQKRIFRFPRCSWNGVKVCYWCRALSQSSDPKDLYWSFEDNNWDDNHFTTDEFFNERVPASGICSLFVLGDAVLSFSFFSPEHLANICSFYVICQAFLHGKVLSLGFGTSIRAPYAGAWCT